MKHAKITRREILAASALAAPFLATPAKVLIQSLVNGLIREAQAVENPQARRPRNYVFLGMFGAPPAWHFHLPLTPYSNGASDFVPNPMIATRFSGNGPDAGAPEYATTTIQRNGITLQLPWLWSSNIPTSDGSSVPMSYLADHALFLRGINMQADGHAINYRRQLRPFESAPSLDGAIADISQAPIPAVACAMSYVNYYRSITGVGLASVANAYDPIQEILNPFLGEIDALPAAYLSRREAMNGLVQQALHSLGKYSKTSLPGSEALYSMRSRAENLIRSGIGDLSQIYPGIVQKYKTLVSRCATTAVAGITDRPIRSEDAPNAALKIYANSAAGSSGTYHLRSSDLRSLISPESNVQTLAEQCAMTEYLLVHGYSSSVTFEVSTIARLLFEKYSLILNGAVSSNVLGPTPGFGSVFDEHDVGLYPSLILNSFLYRSIASCLFELISVLKSKNLFDETVIQLGSEFSRTPRQNCSGSDHAWSAAGAAIFSGAIQGPFVLGNVRPLELPPSDPTHIYNGSWGWSAPVLIDGSRQELGIGHATSTVAALARIKPLAVNNSSLLVELGNDKFSPSVDLAKNTRGDST